MLYPERPRAWWVDYLAAIGMLAAVDAFVIITDPFFPEAFFRVPYLLAVGAVAYLFRPGAAALAVALGLISYWYIAHPISFSFRPANVAASDWAEFITFVLGSVAAAVAMAVIRMNRMRISGLASELADREAILDAFFLQSPVALAILDSELRLARLNPHASSLIGPLTEREVGKPLAELVPEPIRKMIPRLRRILETGEPETNTLVSAETGGEPGRISHQLMTHFPIFSKQGQVTGVGMIALDVTDRVKAEEALERSEARFRAVFDRAGIGMIAVDMGGNVLAANQAFSELTGYDLYELVGMSVQKFAYPEDVAGADELLGRMIQGEFDSFQAEKRYVRKDGKVIWGRLTASIGRALEPEQPFIIGMIEDITDRVNAEEALKAEQSHRTEFYRRTIQAATQDKLVIVDREEIEALDGTLIRSWEIDGPEGLWAARHGVEKAAEAAGLDDNDVANYTMAAGEALTNVVKHAGTGTASLRWRNDRLLFVATDHGPGIEALNLPAVALERGYTTAGTLGVGFTVMIAFSKRVYLYTGPDGTTVALEAHSKTDNRQEEPISGDLPYHSSI